MRVFGILIILIVAPCPFAVRAADQDCIAALSPGLIDDLKDAQSVSEGAYEPDYTVDVMTGEINGVTRTVVLLGEVHHKTPEASEKGVNVIQHFESVGIEGYSHSKNYAGKIRKMLTRAVKLFITKTSPGKSNGSSLKDAATIVTRNKVIRLLEKSGPEALSKTYPTVFSKEVIDLLMRREPTEEERKQYIYDGSIKLVSYRELRDWIVLDRNRMENPNLTVPKELIRLEAGHQASFIEKFYLTYFPIQYFNALLSVPLILGTEIVSHFYPSVSPAIRWELMVGATSWITFAEQFFADQEWAETYLPFSIALVKKRNQTIVTNLVQNFQNNSDKALILGIVGKSHVPGVKRLLVKQGFRPNKIN